MLWPMLQKIFYLVNKNPTYLQAKIKDFALQHVVLCKNCKH